MQNNGQCIGQRSVAMDLKDVKILLPSMTDVDVLSFFMSFERVLILNEVDRVHWSKLLPSQLTSKALRTFSRLSLEESQDYETTKRVKLASYKLDANAYLHTFRTMRTTGKTIYKMFLTNMREVMLRYFDTLIPLKNLVKHFSLSSLSHHFQIM